MGICAHPVFADLAHETRLLGFGVLFVLGDDIATNGILNISCLTLSFLLLRGSIGDPCHT